MATHTQRIRMQNTAPDDIPFALRVWNGRQKKQHQYTPPLTFEQRAEFVIQRHSNATRGGSGTSRGGAAVREGDSSSMGREGLAASSSPSAASPRGTVESTTMHDTRRLESDRVDEREAEFADSLHSALVNESRGVNNNYGYVLPRSHRDLKWDKAHHSAHISPFSEKVTAYAEPSVRAAAAAQPRRVVSHKELQRQIGNHRSQLYNRTYSFD